MVNIISSTVASSSIAVTHSAINSVACGPMMWTPRISPYLASDTIFTKPSCESTIVDSHDGFVKVVSDAKYGEILGVHIIGPQATEIIAECVTAMELEATVEELMFTIHAHPTLSESLLDGFSSVEGMAINV